jgi:MYXO-CTERM domain-containing protein
VLAPLVSTLGLAAALQGHSLAYLDFSDGRERVELAPVDDARANRSHLIATPAFPPFRGDRETRVRIAEAANALFADFDVSFTVERPAEGDYDLVLVGGSGTDVDLPATVLGAAVLDCSNVQPNQIAFVFSDGIDGGPDVVARAVAQELAHTYGLEHTVDFGDVMYPLSIEGPATFVDADRDLAAEPRCGRPTQNSRQRLLTAVGAWTGPVPKPVDGLDSLAADVTPQGGCRVAGAGGGRSPLGLAALAVVGAWSVRRRRR